MFIQIFAQSTKYCDNNVKELQSNHSTTATLGTEESGHCREVETRVNVWNAPPPAGCGEVAVSGDSAVFQMVAVIPELVSAIVEVIWK